MSNPKPKREKKAKAAKILKAGAQLQPEEQAAIQFVNRYTVDGQCNIECYGDKWTVFTNEQGHWMESNADYYLPEMGVHGDLALLPSAAITAKLVRNSIQRVQQIRQQKTDAPAFAGAYDADYAPDGHLLRVVLNAANGEVTLTPGTDGSPAIITFSPTRNRKRRFNRILTARYDPLATCPLYLETRAKVIPHPKNLYLFRMFLGSVYLPFNKFKAALVLYGPSDTFKSKLAEASCLPLGVCHTYIELNNLVKQDSRFTYLLPHSMANISTELSSVTQEDSSTLKTLIACEPTNKRRLYNDGGVMETRAKYLMCSNSLPSFKGGTSAENTRLRFIECKEAFIHVDELVTKLKVEVDGIFMEGLRCAAEAMSITHLPDGDERSVGLRASFATLNDPFSDFVEEWLEKGSPDDFVPNHVLKALYTAHRDWEKMANLQADEFWKRIRQVFEGKRAQRVVETRLVSVSLGIKLKKAPPPIE